MLKGRRRVRVVGEGEGRARGKRHRRAGAIFDEPAVECGGVGLLCLAHWPGVVVEGRTAWDKAIVIMVVGVEMQLQEFPRFGVACQLPAAGPAVFIV